MNRYHAGAAAVAGVFIGLFLSFTAFAATYDLPWTNDMNQESYWETYFGPGTDCTKYENHSGYIGAEYDAAVTKKGSDVVRVYDDLTNTGGFQATHPQGEPPMSWVMKCTFKPVATTTTTTTTTVPDTTTTMAPTTTTAATTTVPAPSSSVPPSTFPEESPPLTPPASTPPAQPQPTRCTNPSDPCDYPALPTTIPPAPATPPPAQTLPETGAETAGIAIAALVAVTLGGILLIIKRKPRTS